MNITIKDKVGLNEQSVLELAISLLKNRQPKPNSFDYGFETHGAIGINFNNNLKIPVQVHQTNKRANEKSIIAITIERHYPI